MTDDQFRELCNTYGFAPSRALRELIDCVRAQEIEACVRLAEETKAPFTADVIRARKDERNFCPRCGKRTQDIHTCTPPSP